MPIGKPAPSRGFTYLLLLFILALGGVGVAALGESERTRQRRIQEAELKFRGSAIAAAIGRYAARTPAGHAPLPQRLDDLVNDRRLPQPQHHLRRLYTDPFTGKPDWELVITEAHVVLQDGDTAPTSQAPTQGIVGVRSRSPAPLFASSNGRRTAHDWVFMSPIAGSSTAEP